MKTIISFLLILCALNSYSQNEKHKYLKEYIFASTYINLTNNDSLKLGVLNKKGNIIKEPIFSDGINEIQGITNISLDGVYGYISNDKIKLFPQFKKAYWNGKIGVAKNSDDKFALIDMSGNLLTEYTFKQIQPTDNYHLYVEEDNATNYINLSGKKIFNDTLKLSWQGIIYSTAIFEFNNKFGLINTNGKIIIEPQYDKIYGDPSSKLLIVANHDKYGIIDINGKIIIPLIYSDINHVVHEKDLIPVKLNGKFGYLNSSNDVVIPFEYEDALPFREGYAKVKKNGKYGFINLQNEVIAPFENDKGWNGENYFNDGLAIVERNKKYGYINTEGKTVIDPIYDKVSNFKNGIAKVKKDGKYGYIDTKGKIVIPLKYTFLSEFNNEQILYIE